MSKNGIIFGKFYPLHIGHVDFIQRASGYVDNLYVVVCTDNDRDKKLFEESQMKKMPTIKDRMRFVEKTFKHQKNIKVIHMAEDGIPFYPNGWKLWSERVQEILLKNNRLDSNTILVIDEPEVHLHPKWQIKYAEFLILISKKLGVRMLLNSHSPYFIRALDVYGEEYKFQDFIKFYTLFQDTKRISTKVVELNKDLSSIFKLLMEPYETFEKILAKSDKDE